MVKEYSGEFVRIHTPYDGVITKQISEDMNLKRNIQPLTWFDPSFYARTIIRQSSNPNNRIMVVLMGDGFTSTQQGNWPTPASGTFLYHVRSATNFMMQTYPFSLFEDLFTVYAIQTISRESGISRPRPWPLSDINVRNRFGSNEPRNNEITMPEWGQNDVRFIAEHFAGGRANLNMIQVIANSDRFGGVAFGATPVTSPIVGIALTTVHTNHGGWRRTFIHEFGHTFGALADELDGAHARRAANMTDDRNNIPWSHWIGYGGIGLPRVIRAYCGRQMYVPRGYDPSIIGATGGCLMTRSSRNIDSFCAVCSSELVRRMAQHHAHETFQPRINGTSSQVTVQPNPQNRILPYAFNGNSFMQHVTIPACIASIGNYAFIGAWGLRTIRNYSTTPQRINSTTFARLNRSNIRLVVPQGSTQAYINAGWTGFNIVEGVPSTWHQPRFTSNSNSHGTITASAHHPGRDPFGAFDGWIGFVGAGNQQGFPAVQWTKQGTTGWIQLRLNYYINVHRIDFYNRSADAGSTDWTRDAYFTGTNGIPLGNPFVGVQTAMGRNTIQVGGVRTNIIRLNITSSWGNWIGANEIVIHATQAPIYISNATELSNIRNNPTGYFRLANDITLTGQWTPIQSFSGILDGNNFRISGINITETGSYLASDVHIGFIRNLLGVVQNIMIPNANIHVSSHHGGNGWLRAGILAGSVWQSGRVINVSIFNSSIVVHRERSSVGGIAGEVRGTINYSSIRLSTVHTNGHLGGITGSTHANGTIILSFVFDVIMRHYHYHYRNDRTIGGIVGFHGDGAGVIRDNLTFYVMLYRINRPGNPSIGAIIGHSLDPNRVISNQHRNTSLSTLNTNGQRVTQAFTIDIGRRGRMDQIIWADGLDIKDYEYHLDYARLCESLYDTM